MTFFVFLAKVVGVCSLGTPMISSGSVYLLCCLTHSGKKSHGGQRPLLSENTSLLDCSTHPRALVLTRTGVSEADAETEPASV